METRVTWLIGGTLLIAGAIAFLFRGEARIVDVRVANHDRYDRVVLELSRSVEIVRRPETRWQDLIVDLRAVPEDPHRELRSDSQRLGTVVIEETPGGARLSSTRQDRRLRLFRLEDPPRLVVDFADSDNLVLSAPRGAWAVPMFSPEGPELAYSSAASPPVAKIRAAAPAVVDEQDPASPGAAAASSWTVSPWLYAAPLLALLGWLVVIGTRKGLETWRRLRVSAEGTVWIAPSLPVSEPMPPGSTDSTQLLARRHAEEVSARMQLEERVHQLQEEVRQLRDGLTRLARRGETRL